MNCLGCQPNAVRSELVPRQTLFHPTLIDEILPISESGIELWTYRVVEKIKKFFGKHSEMLQIHTDKQ